MLPLTHLLSSLTPVSRPWPSAHRPGLADFQTEREDMPAGPGSRQQGLLGTPTPPTRQRVLGRGASLLQAPIPVCEVLPMARSQMELQ